jgi:hypothetical protein
MAAVMANVLGKPFSNGRRLAGVVSQDIMLDASIDALASLHRRTGPNGRRNRPRRLADRRQRLHDLTRFHGLARAGQRTGHVAPSKSQHSQRKRRHNPTSHATHRNFSFPKQGFHNANRPFRDQPAYLPVAPAAPPTMQRCLQGSWHYIGTTITNMIVFKMYTTRQLVPE